MVIYFNLELTRIEIHTPTDLSLCFSGLDIVFIIASIVASSSSLFGTLLNIRVSFTRSF